MKTFELQVTDDQLWWLFQGLALVTSEHGQKIILQEHPKIEIEKMVKELEDLYEKLVECKEMGEFNNEARAMAQKIKDSNMMAAMVTDNYMKNPICATQLGFSIFMNKPIMLIVDKKTPVPPALTRVANLIERVDTENPEDMARARKSIEVAAKNFHA